MEIEKLKQAMISNDPRGASRLTATAEQRKIWYQSYDALEKLLDDDDFEDFLDTLD